MKILPKNEKIQNRVDLLCLFFKKIFSNSILKNSNFFEILYFFKNENNFSFMKFLKSKSKIIFENFLKNTKNSENENFLYFDNNFKKIKILENFLKYFSKKLKNEIKLYKKKKNLEKNSKKIFENKNIFFFEIKKKKNFLIIINYLIDDIFLIKEIVNNFLNLINFQNFEKKNFFIFEKNSKNDKNDFYIKNSNFSEDIKIKIILLKNQFGICIENIEEDIQNILQDYISIYKK